MHGSHKRDRIAVPGSEGAKGTVDARSAGEGALPFGQRVVFAYAQGATGLWPEGVVSPFGHACGVKVQKVLRVLRFDSPSG